MGCLLVTRRGADAGVAERLAKEQRRVTGVAEEEKEEKEEVLTLPARHGGWQYLQRV